MKKVMGLLLVFCMLIGLCPASYAAEYAYEVNGIYFTDLAGNAMENPGRSCVINVEVTKTADRIGNELVVITAYSTDGEMVNFTTVSGTMQKDEEEIFSTLMFIPTDKNVGLVKAFVWNNISEMRAMSTPFAKIVNEMDDGVELPGVGEPPVVETYIPSTVTVEGMITGTSLSANLENNEYHVELYPLELQIDNVYTGDEYDAYVTRMRAISEYYKLPLAIDGDGSIDTDVYSNIDLNGYLFHKGVFELCLSGGEYVVEAFEPKESENITEIPAEDYVLQTRLGESNQYTLSNNRVKFGDTFYKMASKVDIYVNGALYVEDLKPVEDEYYGGNSSQQILDTILGGAQGTVKFIKSDGNNYSVIMVDYYQVAKVTSASYKNGETVITMVTKAPMSDDTDYDEIVVSDDAVSTGLVSVSVTRNGVAADLASIEKGDIIAYAVDFCEYDLEDPRVIDIIATDETATGTVISVDDENHTHTIGEEVYKSVVFNKSDPSLGQSYILTLDPFGRIYETEIIDTTKYAVATRVTSTGALQLVLADGTTNTYEMTSSCAADIDDEVAEVTDYESYSLEDYLNDTSVGATDRVISYTIKNSTGQITSIDLETGTLLDTKEYKARTGKLGSATISATTKVINAAEATNGSLAKKPSSYRAYSVASFEDGAIYSGCAYGMGTTYTSFVVLTSIGEIFPEENSFAVVQGPVSHVQVENGDWCEQVKVIYGGQETDLNLLEGLYGESGLGIGDVFFFERDWDGFVDTIYTIYDYSTGTYKTMLEAGVPEYILPYGTDGWSYNLWNEGRKMQLIEGYVVDVTGSEIYLAPTSVVAAGILDANSEVSANDPSGVATFNFAESCSFSKCDMGAETISVTQNQGGIVPSNIDEFETQPGYYDFTNAENLSGLLNYAIAIIEDGEIVDIISYNNGPITFSDATISGDVSPEGEYKASEYMALFEKDYERTNKVYFGHTGYLLAANAEIYVDDVKIEETITNELLDSYLRYGYEVTLKANTDNTAYASINIVTGVSKNYAVATRITTTGALQIVLPDGTSAEYEMTSSCAAEIDSEVAEATDYTSLEDYLSSVYAEDRVITYTVKNSTGELTSVDLATGTGMSAVEYKPRTGKLGGVTILPTTNIIDASTIEGISMAKKPSNYYAYSADSFVEGITYSGYAFMDGTKTDFVMLTEIRDVFNGDDKFAVVQKAAQTVLNDGEYVDNVTVLYNGNSGEELLFYDGLYEYYGLGVGDAFFFKTDRYGYVDEVYVIYDYSQGTFTTLYDAVLTSIGGEGYEDAAAAMFSSGVDGWDYVLQDTGYSIQLVEGYVTNVTNSAITLAPVAAIEAGELDTNNDIDDNPANGVAVFAIDSECVAYEFDAFNDNIVGLAKRLSVKDASSVKASAFDKWEVDGEKGVYEGYLEDDANYAIAMIVDGDIVAIYTIPKN